MQIQQIVTTLAIRAALTTTETILTTKSKLQRKKTFIFQHFFLNCKQFPVTIRVSHRMS